jgi:hypothetical protein
MSNSLDDFLTRLFAEGHVVFHGPPTDDGADDPAATAELVKAFRIVQLELAGDPIPFDPKMALAAARLLRRACWALVNREERPEALARRLAMPQPPRTPVQHLSADLTFRYLPQVYRRARGLDPADVLTTSLNALLRQWPLSGALAGLDEGPDPEPDFSGHPGLLMLYAERVAHHDRPAWQPKRPPAVDYRELVLHDRS